MSRRSRPIKTRRVYVAASHRLAGSPLLMIPTRWVKFLFAIFLLPVCAILTQTFFTLFARATITQRLCAGQEFWFFSLGAVLWLIAFICLLRPILLYVFGHALTQSVWICVMCCRGSRFRVGWD